MPDLDFTIAVVEIRKLTEYLLAEAHPEGGSKARFFLACGFHPDQPARLASALRQQAAEGDLRTERTPFGLKIVVDGPLGCPDGRQRGLRSVWVLEQATTGLRFVTAYPQRPLR